MVFDVGCKFSTNLIFPEIFGNFQKTSGNIRKSLEVIASIICIRIVDIPASRAKTSYFFLTQCMKLKHKDWSVVCQECAYFTASLCNFWTQD